MDPTTSVVPPTVPPREPTEIDLELDQTLLRTATSLELMAAEAYGEFAGEVQDGEWAATTARFGVDHELAAGAFRSGTDADLQIDEPNEFMQTQLIDPVRDLLTSDRSLLNFFTEIENTLSATYVTAVANHTDAAWRARFSAYASSAARRAALMGAGGQGVVPTGPLLGTEDLIPGEAYLQANPRSRSRSPAKRARAPTVLPPMAATASRATRPRQRRRHHRVIRRSPSRHRVRAEAGGLAD